MPIVATIIDQPKKEGTIRMANMQSSSCYRMLRNGTFESKVPLTSKKKFPGHRTTPTHGHGTPVTCTASSMAVNNRKLLSLSVHKTDFSDGYGRCLCDTMSVMNIRARTRSIFPRQW